MRFEDFRKNVILSFAFGCPPFFAFAAYGRNYESSKISKAMLQSQAFFASHLTVLGFWFGATFGIAKHCFNKDNTEALKIAGIVAGALAGALITLFICDVIIRGSIEKERSSRRTEKRKSVRGNMNLEAALWKAGEDVFLLEGLLCLPVTFLGFAQASIHRARTGENFLF